MIGEFMGRMINGSVSTYVLANAPCAYGFVCFARLNNDCRVCIMGKAVEERVMQEKREEEDKVMHDLLAASDSENEGKAMPFFLPRRESKKDYYTDSD